MTYTFRNKKTGKIVEKQLKVSEYDAFKAANPDLERYFESSTPFQFDTNIQPDSGFQKNVIERIRQKAPGAKDMLRNSKFKVPREW